MYEIVNRYGRYLCVSRTTRLWIRREIYSRTFPAYHVYAQKILCSCLVSRGTGFARVLCICIHIYVQSGSEKTGNFGMRLSSPYIKKYVFTSVSSKTKTEVRAVVG